LVGWKRIGWNYKAGRESYGYSVDCCVRSLRIQGPAEGIAYVNGFIRIIISCNLDRYGEWGYDIGRGSTEGRLGAGRDR
jgi:hypothetical protein